MLIWAMGGPEFRGQYSLGIETGNRKHRLCPTRAALIEGTHVPNIKIQEPVISSD